MFEKNYRTFAEKSSTREKDFQRVKVQCGEEAHRLACWSEPVGRSARRTEACQDKPRGVMG